MRGEPSTVTEILSDEAVAFVAELNRRFRPRRNELLAARAERRAAIAGGAGRWASCRRRRRSGRAIGPVPPAPRDLTDRRVEITGPTERKMTINALNSGAKVWLADLEDANTPHWANVVGGQVRPVRRDPPRTRVHLRPRARPTSLAVAALRRSSCVPAAGTWTNVICRSTASRRGRAGRLRPLLLPQRPELIDRGSGPYFYLPKMESHLEAGLWNDVFELRRGAAGIPHGTIRATVLIETIPAAFEMDEILYELREHASGLNAGRWDYLFSIIKYFRDDRRRFVLPDRASVTMTAPFMRAYTELLVSTCHQRGAFAMGGMAAFIPSRRDPEVNESRWPRSARTRSARPATGSTAPGWRIPTSCRCAGRCSIGCSATGRTNSTGSATTCRWRRATARRGVDAGGAVTEAGLRTNV